MSGAGDVFPAAGALPVSGDGAFQDWTHGGDRLVFHRCSACHQTFYFQRGFCPACGQASPVSLPSAGRGTVHATTLVQRAPDDAFRAVVPYRIVLVDLAEGFRVMGHAEPSLAVGDAAICRIERIAGRLLPFFTSTPSPTNEEVHVP